VSLDGINRNETPYELVVGSVRGLTGEVRRAQIDAMLIGRVAPRTITRYLTKAVERGDLASARKGIYKANLVNGQSANDIGVDQLAAAERVLSEYETQGLIQ